jgi:arsenate reductase
MAEALLKRDGGAAFEVFSAGTEPRGINPLTVSALAKVGIDISDARSKSVTEFLGQQFDYVVTVCDRARETCPVFPGAHESLHWGFDDPAEATGSDTQRAAVFDRVLGEIAARIRRFIPIAARHGTFAKSAVPTS